MSAFMQFEFAMLDAIQKLSNPILDSFMVFITHLGDKGYIWIATAVIMLCFKKTRRCGIMLGAVLILGTLVGNITLKNLFARPRPFIQNSDMANALLIKAPGGYSFPSGHTLSSIECATVIFLNHKKLGIGAIILAVLIAFSRNYLYVHFVTDVIAGAILGIALGYLVYYAINKLLKKSC